MRLLVIGLIAASVSASACNLGDAPAAAASSVTSSAPSSASPPLALAPAVGTSGAAEAAPPPAAVREITLPAGTNLRVILDDTIGSDISRIEQPVRAHLSRAVTVRGQAVIPQGSLVTGVVTDARRSAKVKGRARIAVRFNALVPRGGDDRYALQTGAVSRIAQGTKRDDALKIGLPAAGGAIVGGLIGGKKGALIGTAAGGGAGTAVVLSTRGKEVHLAKGTALTVRLSKPVTVRVSN